MSQFAKLVDLREFELDEQRKRSGDILTEVNRLLAEQKRLEEELIKEQKIASESLEVGFLYNEFASSVIRQREWLSEAITLKEKEYEEARERVSKAYQEMRKAEIVRDEANEKEKKKTLLVEQNEIDEISLNIHRQKKY